MLEVPDYVSIVARTPDGQVMLVRQHRPVMGHDTVELPSGHVDAGETPEQAARRELLEETGMVARDIELLGVLVPDVGRITNRIWCYFAPDVAPATGEVDREDGIVLICATEHEALAMAADGRINHAQNLAALFLAISKGKLRAA
jgi:8-oxo-dGTP pyrophosphatase MutT (NUDIX family)